MDVAVTTTIENAMDGSFTGEPYVGTLENGGVQIAPLHEFEDDVPDELKQQLEDVKQAIISGDIKITSPAQPGQ
jgi:basic membrane protein A